jgi:hypothetical protein
LLVSFLLIATAISKLWMLLTDSFAEIRVGLTREILWLTVAFEFWLAFENLRLRNRRVLAVINTVVFSIFAIFASARWILGYNSCGCSANLELPTWFFVLIDVGIVFWFSSTAENRSQLLIGSRELARLRYDWSPKKRGGLTGLAVFVGLIIVLQFPLAATLRAKVLGEPLIVGIAIFDEELFLEKESTGKIELQNRSTYPAKIIGFSNSCRCFDLADNPNSKILPAYGSVVLPFAIKPKRVGALRQRFDLFLDHPNHFRVNVNVLGFVKGAE